MWFVGHSEARYELAMKFAAPLELPVDGRQSETALAIAAAPRGCCMRTGDAW